jgi:hypothetical protein
MTLLCGALLVGSANAQQVAPEAGSFWGCGRLSDSAIARQLAVNRKTVMLWRGRFAEQGMGSVWEVAPGRGRKPTYGPDKIKAIVDATLQTKPKGMTQWSCRLMAESQEVSKSTISNIWRSHNLKPHRVKNFKLSRDPRFLEKLRCISDESPQQPWSCGR